MLIASLSQVGSRLRLGHVLNGVTIIDATNSAHLLVILRQQQVTGVLLDSSLMDQESTGLLEPELHGQRIPVVLYGALDLQGMHVVSALLPTVLHSIVVKGDEEKA